MGPRQLIVGGGSPDTTQARSRPSPSSRIWSSSTFTKCGPTITEKLRWVFIKERYKEKRKKNRFRPRKKNKNKEKRNKTYFRLRQKVRFKKKERKDELKISITLSTKKK